MSRRAPHYPGIDDPRAALEPLRQPENYLLELQRRFHISMPAYQAIEDVRRAMREAALKLTQDPYFFGGGGGGQTPYKPPPAPPLKGSIPGR